jgi:hypothetical protein
MAEFGSIEYPAYVQRAKESGTRLSHTIPLLKQQPAVQRERNLASRLPPFHGTPDKRQVQHLVGQRRRGGILGQALPCDVDNNVHDFGPTRQLSGTGPGWVPDHQIVVADVFGADLFKLRGRGRPLLRSAQHCRCGFSANL